MQKNRPMGKRQVKVNEVNDGGLLKRNFIDYLWRHMNQGPHTLDELHVLVNEDFREKGRTLMSRGTFVDRLYRLDKDGYVKSVLVKERIVFQAGEKPTDPIHE